VQVRDAHDLAQALRPNDALLSWDIKDAYHLLLIPAEDRKYLAFRANGRVNVPMTMPFGLRSEPRIWTKVCRPVVGRLRALGFRIIAYVDDFWGAPPAPGDAPATKFQAADGWNLVNELLLKLGLRMHPAKGVKDGPTSVQLLGHLIDSRAGLFLLPPARTNKIVLLASQFTRYAATHDRWVNFKELRRFCGTAVSTVLSVPSARYHLRSHLSAMTFRHPRSGDARLGQQAQRDLRW